LLFVVCFSLVQNNPLTRNGLDFFADGPLGVTGVIGWYFPSFLLDYDPDVAVYSYLT